MQDEEYRITLKKIFKHLSVINRHKFKVFCLCCRLGIPWRGLVHDLSKYSPIEFFESVKYFTDGKISPINTCKKQNGYSMAWIHHKNHNKHHFEYWYDYAAETECPVIPFKYFLEMMCDSFAAGLTYRGKEWTKEYQLSYWNKVKEKSKLNPKMRKLMDEVYNDVSKEGLYKVLKRKRLRKMYDEYTK